MRVSDLMSRNVVTIGTWDSCQEAVARMHRAGIRHLPVVDETDRLAGVVTDRDLRHRLFSPEVFRAIGTVPVDALLRTVPITQIMSTPAVTVEPDDDLEAAARLMLEDKVGSLPVVKDGRVVGILTETDLLRRIVRADACAPEVETIIVSFP
ncbi:MAG: CBS domain-containing protein [Candidatus Rokubacteria bacterium]|nr:CBS domain-containing protein [Candidatus Rokubacteria bacterium]